MRSRTILVVFFFLVSAAPALAQTTAVTYAFIGAVSGSANTTGNFNVFVGNSAGNANTTGSNNTISGALADVGLNNLTYATAIGAGATVYTSNTVVLGASADKVSIPGRLDVSSTATFGLTTTSNGLVKLNDLGGSGTTDLCLNASNNIANCSSSLRYKTNGSLQEINMSVRLLISVIVILVSVNAVAQTKAFTYQGNLTDTCRRLGYRLWVFARSRGLQEESRIISFSQR